MDTKPKFIKLEGKRIFDDHDLVMKVALYEAGIKPAPGCTEEEALKDYMLTLPPNSIKPTGYLLKALIYFTIPQKRDDREDTLPRCKEDRPAIAIPQKRDDRKDTLPRCKEDKPAIPCYKLSGKREL